MKNLAQVIQFLYPEAILGENVVVQDDSDGQGPYIAKWDLPIEQPSVETLVTIESGPDFIVWKKALVMAHVDLGIGQAIDRQIHSCAPIEEQIGILRDQLVQILNALGLEPTAEFANLNAVAIEKIQEGQTKKEAL